MKLAHSDAEPYMTLRTVKTTDELCLCWYVFHVRLTTAVWEKECQYYSSDTSILLNKIICNR